MAVVFNLLAKLRKGPASTAGAALPAEQDEPRSPRQMIAGCEYELRRMRRDMQAAWVVRAVPETVPAVREPFVLGARLRNDDFRAKLAATTGSRATETASGTG